MRSLVIDDKAVCRLLLEGMLKIYGKVDLASDGVSALDSFSAALKKGEPYNLVCIDVRMPGMDGHAVLKSLRCLEDASGVKLGSGAKIIMISASSENSDVMAAFRSSCDAYLVKPVARVELQARLLELGLLPTT